MSSATYLTLPTQMRCKAVHAGNGSDVLTFSNRQDAAKWLWRNTVHPPASIPIPGSTADEIINSLPRFVQGAEGIADNAHGLLVVNGKAYRIGSGGPNIADGFAQRLAPSNASELASGFTPQNINHVEGSASAILQNLAASGEEVASARLYLNVDALCGGNAGCAANLSSMLPQGTRMEVFGSLVQGGRRRATALGTFGR